MGNDEISLSLEESNRLRASLGLPPLKVDPVKEEEKEVPVKPVASGPAVASDEVRARLEAARARRRQGQLEGTKSLGEQLAASQGHNSALGWVESNREAQAAQRPVPEARHRRKAVKAPTIDNRFDEEEKDAVGAADLEGVKVGHDVDSFKLGESVVLTLEDKPVLRGDGDDEDTLVNVNLAEDQRRRRAREMASSGVGKEMDQFGDAHGLLHKYDDAEGPATFTIGAKGVVSVAADKRTAALRAEREAAAEGKLLHDLSAYHSVAPTIGEGLGSEAGAVGAAVGSDFLTAAEASAAFKKTDGKGKRMRKKKKKAADGLAAMDADVDPVAAKTWDRASGGDRAQRALDRHAEHAAAAAEKVSRYGQALRAAEAGAEEAGPGAAAKLEPVANATEAQRRAARAAAVGAALRREAGGEMDNWAVAGDGLEEAEVDPELYSALSRVRRLNARPAAPRVAAEEVAGLAAGSRHAALRQALGGHGRADPDEMDVDTKVDKDAPSLDVADDLGAAGALFARHGARGSAPGLVFSKTTEFVRGLRPREEGEADMLPSERLRARARGEREDVKMEVDEASELATAAEHSPPLVQDGQPASPEDGGAPRADGREEQEQTSARDASDGFGAEDHLASEGMAAALNLARSRGHLSAPAPGTVGLVGRANDLKGSGMHLLDSGPGEDRVSLQYLDEYGRPMTQKEAWRKFNHKFHGKGPGISSGGPRPGCRALTCAPSIHVSHLPTPAPCRH